MGRAENNGDAHVACLTRARLSHLLASRSRDRDRLASDVSGFGVAIVLPPFSLSLLPRNAGTLPSSRPARAARHSSSMPTPRNISRKVPMDAQGTSAAMAVASMASMASVPASGPTAAAAAASAAIPSASASCRRCQVGGGDVQVMGCGCCLHAVRLVLYMYMHDYI